MHGAPHLQPMNRIVVREPVNQPLKGMGLLERMLQTRDEPAAVFFLCGHGYASFALSVHGPAALAPAVRRANGHSALPRPPVPA